MACSDIDRQITERLQTLTIYFISSTYFDNSNLFIASACGDLIDHSPDLISHGDPLPLPLVSGPLDGNVSPIVVAECFKGHRIEVVFKRLQRKGRVFQLVSN